MNYIPLLNAGPAVHIHLAATILALALGAFMLIRRKGTVSHRALGWIWVVLMLTAATSSFWITGITGSYSPIHALSLLVLVLVPLAVLAIRRGKVKRHRMAMIGLFFGALVIPGLFTLLPMRLLGRLMTEGVTLLTLAQ
ncbi:DUF2306 domain-containing protein [Ferrovibrio terrae]|uniref:DUF2306 domain-containing protein n=1 Tax=Ferrovibrio terrae TaxID=2594003 RepID=A0A516GXC1_9PROT|nr:DUF2306 domain-containing protein [Ferrovibrio terrae]QDO96198.1 DUF2306 domain-containing protein [Ferrovibrio terrae]